MHFPQNHTAFTLTVKIKKIYYSIYVSQKRKENRRKKKNLTSRGYCFSFLLVSDGSLRECDGDKPLAKHEVRDACQLSLSSLQAVKRTWLLTEAANLPLWPKGYEEHCSSFQMSCVGGQLHYTHLTLSMLLFLPFCSVISVVFKDISPAHVSSTEHANCLHNLAWDGFSLSWFRM